MVDTGVTEITKVGTPFRSFIMNIAGLAFLVVTWQQLLGNSSSAWLTTLTFVGAGLSLAVIVALYFSRKSQLAKFVADQEAGKKILPTEEEAEAEEAEEAEEDVEEEAEEVVTEEEPPEEDESPPEEIEEDLQETADEVEEETFEEIEEESVEASEESEVEDEDVSDDDE